MSSTFKIKHGGCITEDIIPALVRTFRCGGLEDSGARRTHDHKHAMHLLAASEFGCSFLAGVCTCACVDVEGCDQDDPFLN